MHRWLLLPILLASAVLALANDKPFPPSEAARHMTAPDGFHVTLFAGEPDVVQPIAFTFDDRGRLWVAECLSYPNWRADGKGGHDRILIFEDRHGNGRFDTCKVFCDNIANISGLEVGFGGVWVCATPRLLFIPDRDGNDRPDGPPEVVLDGWDLKAQHNVFNSLTWGPDGWLYGCNGILSNSRVGKPGAAAKERTPLNCGVWRYHPVQRRFEVVAHGTTNPWGLDFDDYGQMFITNCVIKHLWHVVPGAHFQRMFGQDLNPNSYELMEGCADHIHWAGGPWTSSRGGQGKHGDAGGGHAHVGCMLYEGDNWPSAYRDHVFMCNVHGNRINQDLLERHGSGYVAHHGRDFLFANDSWFRGLCIHYGPDGGVYVSDWTDTGECHNYEKVDRTNGRIYKITYGHAKPWRGNIATLTDEQLVACQLQHNDWHVRHARRVLQERAVAGKLDPATHARLWSILDDNADVTRKLRALWSLHVTGGLDEMQLLVLLDSPHETIRAWVIQLSLEKRQPSAGLLNKLAALARSDPSPFVRLYLASGLQRLPAGERWPILEALLGHAEDASDANLPLMLWYATEPLVLLDRARAVELLAMTKIPQVREFIARRLADPRRLIALLTRESDPIVHRDVLRGLQSVYEGWRQAPMPDGWGTAYEKLTHSPNTEVRRRTLSLAVLFGDDKAVLHLRKILADPKAELDARQHALSTLLDKKDPQLLPLLFGLLDDQDLRGAALRSLAAYQDEATPRMILTRYATFSNGEKADAIQTLASRPSYALDLLNAVEQGKVARRDLSAFTVRQLMALRNKQIDAKLAKVWGTIRPASQQKAKLMARYKRLLTSDFLANADLLRGRSVYAQTCASCHRIFGEGGDVGPELTGSQRANLDYILENVLDPSAVVAKEYQVTVLETREGRVLTGIVKQETEKTVTLQTQNEKLTLPKNEIETRTTSPLSMMPEGLLEKLTNEEVRDLIAYLASPQQVPLPRSASK
jgi:putative membrane-bound dehydrogenase-like protein